jgi:hypothetical protein
MLRSRRPPRALALLAAITLCSVALAATLPDTTFLIRAGQHEDSTPGSIAAFCFGTHMDRTLSFQVLFPASAAYVTVDAANQLDWNKVMGITTLLIQRNSIRLGWRWLPPEGKFELGFYGYLKGQRIMQPLVKVLPGAWTDVTLEMHRDRLVAEAGGVRHEARGNLGLSMFFPTPTWVLKTAYFGGDETAPHDMQVFVRGIRTN